MHMKTYDLRVVSDMFPACNF